MSHPIWILNFSLSDFSVVQIEAYVTPEGRLTANLRHAGETLWYAGYACVGYPGANLSSIAAKRAVLSIFTERGNKYAESYTGPQRSFAEAYGAEIDALPTITLAS